MPKRFSISWIVIATGLLTVALSAQQRGGRGGRGGPPEPPRWPADAEYLQWPLPAGEQAYAKISGSHLKEYVNQITAISRKSRDDGNQYWGRITGTPYDKQTTDWVAAQFRRIGLEQVRIQEFDLPEQWFPTSWDVTVSGGGKTLPIKTAFPLSGSVGTPASGVELEPMWVGLGAEADYLSRDARGKAVFVYSIPTPSGRNHSASWSGAVARAEQHGAAAIVIVYGIPGNATVEPAGSGATPPAKVPVLMFGQQDGTSVREMIEQGQAPKLRIRLNIEKKTGLKTASVWGVLPGATDENIFVMAHTESFFEGALDNASGMATMLGLAEHFITVPKAQRRRTMTFATTSAHHAYAPEAGIHWIHEHMGAFFAKTALIVNCEHTSQTQAYWLGAGLMPSNTVSARRWFVGGSDQLKSIVANAFKTFGVAIYSRPEAGAGGELSVLDTEAPSVHIIDHTFYHTDMDVPALVPAHGMESVARAYAKIIDQVNKVDLTVLRQGIPTQ